MLFAIGLSLYQLQASKKQIALLSETSKICRGQVKSPATSPRDKCHKKTYKDPMACLYTCGQVLKRGQAEIFRNFEP